MAVEKRAMNDQAKMKRRDEILQCAWRLFKENDGRLPTVSVIARQAGVSKGCVYLYFKTKNEIFLHLYIHQLAQWHSSVEKKLRKKKDRVSIEWYAEQTADYLVSHPMLLTLGSIVTGVLEENVDEQVIMDIKIEFAQILGDRSRMTAELFPGLTVNQWMNVHLRVYALIFGLWQMFYNSPHIKQLLENTEIGLFESDFRKSAINSAVTFLKGALDRAEQGSSNQQE